MLTGKIILKGGGNFLAVRISLDCDLGRLILDKYICELSKLLLALWGVHIVNLHVVDVMSGIGHVVSPEHHNLRLAGTGILRPRPNRRTQQDRNDSNYRSKTHQKPPLATLCTQMRSSKRHPPPRRP